MDVNAMKAVQAAEALPVVPQGHFPAAYLQVLIFLGMGALSNQHQWAHGLYLPPAASLIPHICTQPPVLPKKGTPWWWSAAL